MVSQGRGLSGAKNGITNSEKCKCSEILTENLKVEGS
jgi:hypothetical protein